MPTSPRSQSLTLGSVTVTLWPAVGYEISVAATQGVVGYAFDHQEGFDAFASDRKRPFRRAANTVAWVPPQCPVYSWSRHGGEYLTIDEIESGGERLFGDCPTTGVSEAGGRRAALALRRFILSRAELDSGEIEEAIDDLCASSLVCSHPTALALSDWLTPARRKCIDEFIDANISNSIGVADIAATLGLSSGFLTRAFVRSLGTTPHAYVMNRRLSRARHMLAHSAMPIAQIATHCGFAHQSHLNRHVFRDTGLSPVKYRLAYQRVCYRSSTLPPT